jgi:4'-phosphopantetheinyl transferase
VAGDGAGAAAALAALGDGECQVWWATPSLARDWHVEVLSADERARRARLRRAEDRDRFTVGCALLRVIVGGLTAVAPSAVALDRTCPDCDRPHGKPIPRDAGGLQCSVSHSGDRVVVAVHRGAAIGVDVERVPASLEDALVVRVLRADERAALDRLDALDRRWGFATYWTRKEAILKATGQGLRVAPDLIGVSSPVDLPRVLEVDDALLPRPISLHPLRPGAGYAACVAVIGAPPTAVPELGAAPLLAEPRPVASGRS